MARNPMEHEMKVVETMVRVYCQGQGHDRRSADPLCPKCRSLLLFAQERIQKCRFGKGKPFCSGCENHCYPPKKREEIRQVMRFAGPRMLFYHPLTAIRHLWKERRLR